VTLGRLTTLQTEILRILAGMSPPWTLSGGAALAAVHTRHRDTRDLDLFWQRTGPLGAPPDEVIKRLKAPRHALPMIGYSSTGSPSSPWYGTYGSLIAYSAHPLSLPRRRGYSHGPHFQGPKVSKQTWN
jgi:hypothetical protein